MADAGTTFDLDLDAVSRPDLRVKLDGKIWRLPGGPRSETVVDLAALFDAFDKAVQEGEGDRLKELSDEIRELIYGLFAERHDEEDLESLPPLDDEQMAEIFKLLVNQIRVARDDAAAEVAERPTSPTSTAKPKNAGRSRASSPARKRARAKTS